MQFVEFLIRLISRVDMPAQRYISRVWPIQFAGAIAFSIIGALINTAIHDTREVLDPNDFPADASLLIAGFLIVVATPILETLLMWGVLALIRRFLTSNPIIASLISGIGWGVAHGLINAFANGISTAWSFTIFSLVFIANQKLSTSRAFWVVVIMHGLTNLIPTLLLFGMVMSR